MQKLLALFTLILICFLMSACVYRQDKAGILLNRHPITEKNIYDYEKSFPIGSRVYYVILMPKKVESRYLYLQVIKNDNGYGRLGYDLIWTKDVRLKDEEVHYYTDYFVLNQKGFYTLKVYSKDNPRKTFAYYDFYVGN